ncbi:helix-turn-helix domain-containing protein [Mycolicibacillus trivialis]|uniref:TetR family transcriptional regulator n=1 Tax=Mycolicibacillus trivialis TaxID=1798 RepID=A0A1X2EGX1_9MYCO|nr:TetR/AcrR family transcriptional regulator [Mycolicibacillus trivialis]ORX01650.1 TetR family transcriptional regulator [Mycolicibacillus trivialis]
MPPATSRGPGRPPAASGAETRQNIIRAAREVFAEVGYGAATFQEIANRAGLTRPAINHYFSDKGALFREVLAETNVLAVGTGIERANAETTLRGRLTAFTASAVEAAAADRSVAAFMVTAMLEARRDPGLMPAGADPLARSRRFLTGVVEDAIVNGDCDSDVDAAGLVEVLVSTLWGLGFYAGFIGDPVEVRAAGERVAMLLTNRLWRVRD